MVTGSRGRLLAAVAILLALASVLQWHSGAYTADLSSDEDEPAHVVSGLMVHDYAISLFARSSVPWPRTPRAFAEAYYVHYPKVAIGHWPPLFYVIEAVWMFLFGRSKAALLLLSLAVMTTTAVIIWRQVNRDTQSEIAAICAAVIFLVLPVSQQALYGVLPDAFLALLTCAAAVSVAHILRRKNRAWSGFWMLAASAVLIHARGSSLLLLPWLAVVLAGRTECFRDRGLWVSGALCVAVGIPWLLFVHQAASPSFGSVVKNAAAFPGQVVQELGYFPSVLALLGALTVLRRTHVGRAAAVAAVLAGWVFFSFAIVPWNGRYFLALLPPCILLIGGGWQWLAARVSSLTSSSPRFAATALAVFTAAVCVFHGIPLRQKADNNYEAVVRRAMQGIDSNGIVYLIAGNPRSEGAFVAAADLADSPGRHIVLRSTKVLAKTDWSQSYYWPLFGSSGQIADYLEKSPISLVVLQNGTLYRPDLTMLKAALRDSPCWVELPPASHALLYRRTCPLPRGPITIRLDMGESLKKYVEWTQ